MCLETIPKISRGFSATSPRGVYLSPPALCDAAALQDHLERPQGSRTSSWLASSILSNGGEELAGSTAAAAISPGVTSLNPLE